MALIFGQEKIITQLMGRLANLSVENKLAQLALPFKVRRKPMKPKYAIIYI